MARRIAIIIGSLAATLVLVLFLLWLTSPDPKGNPASLEGEPLAAGLPDPTEAWTIARRRLPDGRIETLLVTGRDGERISFSSLSQVVGDYGADPFRVLAAVGEDRLEGLAREGGGQVPIAALLPAASPGDRHVATGTNFPEHAQEAASEAVFQFPKFGRASPARTTVAARAGTLLDYEVELCMRFDRPVASLRDFDEAVKGLFLCADFTDRAQLIHMIDPDNLDSGSGFSDAKSRADFFPSGPFLVIPRDWRRFVAGERMATLVNGDYRQDARGGEMTLDFRALAAKALADMDRPRFLYRGRRYRLAPNARIEADMTLMSGTSEGVIFTPPSRADMIEGAASWLFSGGWWQGRGLVDDVIEGFIANELASGHFLQPGDRVEFRSSRLGDIRVDVSPPEPRPRR